MVARERARRLASFDAEYESIARDADVLSAANTSTLSTVSGRTSPLPVLAAEGDSWFDYPPFAGWGRPGGVVSSTANLLSVPILNLAHAGDEARQMLGVDQRRRLERLLTDDRRPLDGLLFSGGGNDIVGDQLALLLRDNVGQSTSESFHEDRLDAALTLVLSAYRDLRTMRDQLRPSCVLFVHAYDVGFPDGRGVCGVGPWLQPALSVRRWEPEELGREVLRGLLGRFCDRLQAFCSEDAAGRTVLVATHGTLPRRSDWHNELHPSRDGFEKIAVKFAATIRERLMS
jgi:hypothetical protein